MQFLSSFALLAVASSIEVAALEATTISVTPSGTIGEPDWFQTSPQSFQGVTATGSAPLLAQTNPAPFGQKTYLPNEPLQTSEPIQGARGRNIFHLMGNFSPYYSSEDGFGVDEHPLPKGSNISQVYLIHRHGSRYPSDSESVAQFALRIVNATAAGTKFTEELAFLNDFSWKEGVNVLVPQGRQELFDSGVLHYYNYGALYRANSSKLVVRSTTIDRALKSAENFLAGFFGLEWKDHADILPMISDTGYNNSLAGTGNCANAGQVFANLENEAMQTWQGIYLKDKTQHLRRMAHGFNWTVSDSYNAQTLCAYETVSFGYSPFCQLFSYEEWKGFSYSMSIMSSSLMGFASPVGRANGIAWVAEFLARVNGHLLNIAPESTSANQTLDTNPVTFPLDQALYLDFGHDSSIMGALTAFGLRQFADYLPPTGPPSQQQYNASKIVPFAGRLNIEIIEAPHAVKTRRPSGDHLGPYVAMTDRTRYVHFLLNQRTVPLHASFKACEYRDDGWCELSTFLDIQKQSLAKAQFQYSCEGNWTIGSYGSVTDGVPPQ